MSDVSASLDGVEAVFLDLDGTIHRSSWPEPCCSEEDGIHSSRRMYVFEPDPSNSTLP